MASVQGLTPARPRSCSTLPPQTCSTAVRLRSRTRGRVLGWALGLSLGLGACSAPQQLDMGQSIRTPLDTTAPAPSNAAAPSERTLDLEHWRPLLQLPEFAQVQAALAEEHAQEAATAFKFALEEQARRRGTSGAEAIEPAAWFQLGRLQELAGDLKSATESYQRAAGGEWVLRDYARYAAGSAQLARGQARAALTSFDAIEAPLPLPLALRRGEAQRLLGERTAAIASLRSFLVAEHPEGWVRASLLLARTLLNDLPKAPSSAVSLDDQLEALRLVRRVETEAAGTDFAGDAMELERKVLGGLSAEEFKRQSPLSPEDQLVRLAALVESQRFTDAGVAAAELLSAVRDNKGSDTTRCEAELLAAKALAGLRKWTDAGIRIEAVLGGCTDPDWRARAYFVAGRYALSEDRSADAARLFGALEKEAPGHRLADDARVKGAYAYLQLGDEARFTQLLSSIAEDYPSGDTTLDGLFDLALRRIEKGDWAGAALVLERGLTAARLADQSRDQESAGRERYFLARAFIETGESERGYGEFAALIAEHPLSYYMQHAYSRLWAKDAARAEKAVQTASVGTEQQPFAFRWRPQFDTPAFQRALQLMRVSEVEWAALEIATLAPSGEAMDPDLSWALALLYERAGSTNLSQKLVQGKLTDWLARWPVGGWRKAWEVAFPRPHYTIVQREAKKNEIPEALIYGVMREESVFDARAVSHADAYGLMQLVKPTAQHFAKKLKIPVSEALLLRPQTNIALGSRVLRDYQAQFPLNPLLAIPAYNAGPGRPKRWLAERPNADFDVWVELIPYRETRRYTKRVLASRGVYTLLYGDAGTTALRLPRSANGG